MWIVCPNPDCPSRTKVFTTTRGWHTHLTWSPTCSDIYDQALIVRNRQSIQRPSSRPKVSTIRKSKYTNRVAGHYLYAQIPDSLKQTSPPSELQQSPVLDSNSGQSNLVLTGLDDLSDDDVDDVVVDDDDDDDDYNAGVFIGVNEENVAKAHDAGNNEVAVAAHGIANAPIATHNNTNAFSGTATTLLPHTVEEAAVVDLLRLLDTSNAPDYMFQSVRQDAIHSRSNYRSGCGSSIHQRS